jgi:hypothetical protein
MHGGGIVEGTQAVILVKKFFKLKMNIAGYY